MDPRANERPSSLLTRRRAGVLLHPTSLPGPHGMGDLGAGARRFIDWLASAGMALWQVLPLGPTGNNCPYVCWSAFAGNPLLVDLGALAEHGLLDASDLDTGESGASRTPISPFGEGAPAHGLIDYDAVRAFKEPRLAQAAARLLANPKHALTTPFEAFRARATWARDASLFALIKRRHGGAAYWEWERPLALRDAGALAELERAHGRELDAIVAELFFFEHQWSELRAYAKSRNIAIAGDLPIYVDRDSVDVWTHPDLFFLDDEGVPTAVSGVPPDYFSALGQLWGNPLYRWLKMAEDDYAWWRGRLGRVLEQADYVRIDHFRGLAAYWEVPAGAPDARTGQWIQGPGLAFFQALERHMGKLPLIAEDLGIIDDSVTTLRQAAGLPGMRVLEFAFGGGADNPHLPHNHTPDSVVYPGTHDNDTAIGWWKSADAHAKRHVQRYLRTTGQEIHWDLIHACFASVAATAVVPMQDILGLGPEARMNNPATRAGNWRFKLHGDPFRDDHAARLRELAEVYGRV